MKKIFRNLMMLLCALPALVSCDESGDKIYLDGFKASDLMASASDVKLSVDNSKDVVLSLAWQNPTLLSSDETKRVWRIEIGEHLFLTRIQNIDVTHINEIWSNLYLADIAVSGIKIATHLTLDTEIER